MIAEPRTARRSRDSRRACRGVLLLAAWLGVSGALRADAKTPEIPVRLGPQKVLLKHGQLGLKYFPDGAVSVLRPTRAAACRMIVPVGIWTYLVEGNSLDELTAARRVLAPGPAGQFDNGYAGVSSVYRHPDGKLYGFYHAEDQEGMPPIGGGVPGFFCSVGLCVSGDEGRSWRKLGQVITSAKPKNWTAFANQADRGAGEITVVAGRDGKHLLAYYTEHSRMANRGVQICLARADISDARTPPGPGRWHKYRKGRFGPPGIGGLDTPVVSAAGLDDADAAFPHVSYSPHLGRYVMVYNINVWKEYVTPGRTPAKSGIHVAYSADGIRWSAPHRLVRDYAVSRPGKSVSWHPTIVWSDARRSRGRLVYSHSPRWNHAHLGGTPHYMVAKDIGFDAARPPAK